MSKTMLLIVLLAALSLAAGAGLIAQDHSSPAGAAAREGTAHEDPVTPILLALILILGAGKLGGELFERLNQPAVLGELVAGIVIGNVVLLNPGWTFLEPLRAEALTVHWAVVVDALARVGVILLLFEVGLESTIGEMRKVGLSSFLVAVVGVIAPFVLGYFISRMFVTEVPPTILAISPSFDINNIHLFIGAILCATSVGITARVLKDLGKITTPESRIVLGAAVIDDVLGLIILAVVGGIVVAAEGGAAMGTGDVILIILVSFGFLAGSLVAGLTIVPKALNALARFRTQGMMIVSAVLFCFAVSWLAGLAGLAPIVGAFASGLILEEVHFTKFGEKRTLHDLLNPVTTLFVPVFFVLMGIQVHLETFAQTSVLGIAAGLTVAAIVGKQVCGLAVVERGLDRIMVGLGMIPRGEVGLIMAGIGKSLGVVDNAIFSAVVIMVVLTTILTPPFLKARIGFTERRSKASATS